MDQEKSSKVVEEEKKGLNIRDEKLKEASISKDGNGSIEVMDKNRQSVGSSPAKTGKESKSIYNAAEPDEGSHEVKEGKKL